MKATGLAVWRVALVGLLFIGNVRAQPLVNIETVAVGDPGNAADITGYGAVSNVFAIGKYEVTIGQYSTFLNSVASVTSDSYIVNLWNVAMATNLNIAGISRSGSGTLADPYSYSVIGSGIRPIVYVNWFDAARFANWINNGATNGASTETGAYTLNGATTGIIVKNAGSTWSLPSEDEWYKSAYYKGGGTNAGYWIYPTKSNTAPSALPIPSDDPNSANYANVRPVGNKLTQVGAYGRSQSTYGTFDQGGNVSEWNDAVGSAPPSRGVRGGDWGSFETILRSSSRGFTAPFIDNNDVGFRLATVPEPSTYALLLITSAATLWHLRRRR